jgi:hypothetical protein
VPPRRRALPECLQSSRPNWDNARADHLCAVVALSWCGVVRHRLMARKRPHPWCAVRERPRSSERGPNGVSTPEDAGVAVQDQTRQSRDKVPTFWHECGDRVLLTTGRRGRAGGEFRLLLPCMFGSWSACTSTRASTSRRSRSLLVPTAGLFVF